MWEEHKCQQGFWRQDTQWFWSKIPVHKVISSYPGTSVCRLAPSLQIGTFSSVNKSELCEYEYLPSCCSQFGAHVKIVHVLCQHWILCTHLVFMPRWAEVRGVILKTVETNLWKEKWNNCVFKIILLSDGVYFMCEGSITHFCSHSLQWILQK